MLERLKGNSNGSKSKENGRGVEVGETVRGVDRRRKEGGRTVFYIAFFVCYALVLCIRLLLKNLFLASPRWT